jgi:hypothetical protein
MLREYALLRVFRIGIYAMCRVHALSDQQRKVLRDPGLCPHSRAGPHLQVFMCITCFGPLISYGTEGNYMAYNEVLLFLFCFTRDPRYKL